MQPPPIAARVRGGAVGALSGAVGIAAHGAAGGGEPPNQSAVTLLLAVCAGIGTLVAAFPVARHRVPFLVSALASGQLLAHGALSLVGHGGHGGHGASGTGAAMLGAHLAAIAVCTIVVLAAENAAAALASRVRRLVHAVVGVLSSPTPLWVVAPATEGGVHRRRLLADAITTRGPPRFVPSAFPLGISSLH
ncbi:hypothetical protein DW322_01470 [Rhodococcus rhodnii]|uniref:Uncharacterized protein n=2 Tax=Rhodococcus rhodnii TaxID=38312 RepID=R7WH33_9NOCA|nr:hypothetical protein [Rhodococcus rhodnii]EOM74460.1 hypothetical protein Rrhod_4262 [Rhodococcus rhodnii LMG 5362]TXG89156.1 hypothetical protein DW322_01470 [Rhodococcus rhodnii]